MTEWVTQEFFSVLDISTSTYWCSISDSLFLAELSLVLALHMLQVDHFGVWLGPMVKQQVGMSVLKSTLCDIT